MHEESGVEERRLKAWGSEDSLPHKGQRPEGGRLGVVVAALRLKDVPLDVSTELIAMAVAIGGIIALNSEVASIDQNPGFEEAGFLESDQCC